MQAVLICVAALAASGLTLFSGFGLGTVLMPVIAIFFPVPMAIAITAVVHLANSLFKLVLLWRDVDRRVFLAFGFPALLAAIPGALLLDYLSGLDPIARYQLATRQFAIMPVKLAAGLLLVVFATAELVPFLNRLTDKWLGLSAGGVLSGFFGGLSGHQGAFRSAFLIRAGLGKNPFVATNAAIAVLVDASRILVYGVSFDIAFIQGQSALILLATASAFLGAFIGTRLLRKVTIGFIQKFVAGMLYGLGGLLAAGII